MAVADAPSAPFPGRDGHQGPQADLPPEEVAEGAVVLAEVAADAGPLPPDRFLDRELSWLAFNERVLQLAEDPGLPALERAKFIAIFASNLDEFFMVRVAGLKRRIATGIAVRAASGLTPREVLENIWNRGHLLQLQQAVIFRDEVRPALAAAGVEILGWADLTEKERLDMDAFFDQRVFPILTPLAVDPSHPFPSPHFCMAGPPQTHKGASSLQPSWGVPWA